ncbi:hypothetical protein [Streptomyces sp. NPDC000405]|uniref:hypothetical protein n=1 Tax=Streptomyces sp. NPDC000405 TaxID=3161033 RepID=UPI00398D240A
MLSLHFQHSRFSVRIRRETVTAHPGGTTYHHQGGAAAAGCQGLRRDPAALGGRALVVVDHAGPPHCRDHERFPQMSESLITWAAITLMTRRLTRRKACPAERRDVAHGYVMPQAA